MNNVEKIKFIWDSINDYVNNHSYDECKDKYSHGWEVDPGIWDFEYACLLGTITNVKGRPVLSDDIEVFYKDYVKTGILINELNDKLNEGELDFYD